MPFVVDASVAMAWHFHDEHSPIAEALSARTRTEAVVVPAHWAVEVANAVLNGERRKRASLDQADEFLARLAAISFEVDTLVRDELFATVLPLAREHRLTVYDAIYLELAVRRGLPLASFDADLNVAAGKAGVALLGVA